jgi:hypothetical protein
MLVWRLATEAIDANDMLFCIALLPKHNVHTTLQRMNAIILRSTQVKTSRRLGMMREVDLDILNVKWQVSTFIYLMNWRPSWQDLCNSITAKKKDQRYLFIYLL